MRNIIITLFIYGCSYGQNNCQKINSGNLKSKNNTISIGEIYIESNNRKIVTEEKTKEQVVNQKKIIIYPNPSSSIFYFETSENLRNERVYIYEINGKLVSSLIIQNKSIDLSNLNNGIFLLRFENHDFNELKITKN